MVFPDCNWCGLFVFGRRERETEVGSPIGRWLNDDEFTSKNLLLTMLRVPKGFFLSWCSFFLLSLESVFVYVCVYVWVIKWNSHVSLICRRCQSWKDRRNLMFLSYVADKETSGIQLMCVFCFFYRVIVVASIEYKRPSSTLAGTDDLRP